MGIRNLKKNIKKAKIKKIMNRDSGSQMNLIFEDNQTDALKPLETFGIEKHG